MTLRPTARTLRSFRIDEHVRVSDGCAEAYAGAEGDVVGWITHTGYLVIRITDGTRVCIPPEALVSMTPE